MSRRDAGFRAAVRRAVRPPDLALLALPVLAMLGVYALPHATKARLALRYEHPSLLSLYTSSFVHFAPGHLAGDVVAYLVVVAVVYLLSVLGGRRGLFLASFVTFLLVLPWVLGALNVALARPRLGCGFSGVDMAFFGLLPGALLSYIDSQFTDDVGIRHSPVLFFAGAALIAVFALPSFSVPSVAVTAIAVGTTLGYGRDVRADLEEFSLDGFRRATVQDGGYLELAVTAVACFGCFLFLAFPSDPAAHDAVLNLYEHLLGYCLGYLSPFITVFVAGHLGYGKGFEERD